MFCGNQVPTKVPVASKLIESVACAQMTEYLESNHLLPENQHGLRSKRSTMSAWETLQQEWSENTEEKKTTGVLLCDLTAAFYT